MTYTMKLGLALILSVYAAFAYADPPGRAGRLNYVHGTVSFAPAPAPDAWSVAVANRPLTAGDRLWTDRDGYAELHVGSTAVRLAPHTNLDVLTLDDDTLQLRLAQGDVNVRVRDVSDDTIELDTPNGAVLLEEAGSYRISTSANGDTTNVIVHSGRAHVLAQHGSFSIRAGQHVTLRGPDGMPSEYVAARMDPFDRWSAELDRREDEVLSTRYVSPRMTGYEDLDAHGTWRTMPEYGAVWVPSVSAGWAPYRHGHWVWIEPWGWTWVDDAPWGFAPFHYGRWVWLNGYWAWAPGPRIARPVYAPALVAFVGGSSWSVSIGSGPAVGWFPLGWREPYFPWYRASPTYVRNVNVTHVKNINIYNNVTRVNYVNQSLPQAVTVVPKEAFVTARPVARSVVQLPAGHATRAPLIKSMPADPVASSFATRRAESRPPEAAIRREVIGARAPRAQAAPQNQSASDTNAGRNEGQRAGPAPRVRVIERQRADADAPSRANAPAEAPTRATAPDTTPRARGEAKPPSRPAPQAQQEAERRARAADEARTQRGSGAQRNEAQSTEPPREAQARNRAAPSSPQASRAQPQAEADRERHAAPRAQQPSRAQPQADVERERRAAPPPAAARPQGEVGRQPRAEPDPRAERRAPQADRTPPRSEPQPRPSRRNEAEPPRERRSSPGDNRSQQREPRSQAKPAPQAAARPEPARPPRPAAQAAPQSQPRASAPRPEARGPQNAPSPRAGGGQGRENRKRDDR
ncbi:MAG TPA: DUF6600 domain-containing protein [Burkholderiales bacterium]|nr:DUF6600 domain-containing protein [Burkholderiales bacterium]